MKDNIHEIESLASLFLSNFKRIVDSCETIEHFSSGVIDYGTQLANILRRKAEFKKPCFIYRYTYDKKVKNIIGEFYNDIIAILFHNHIRLSKPKTNNKSMDSK